MKKILIPTLLTISASPLISLTACNDHGSIPPAPEGAIIIDQWTKTEIDGFFAIATPIDPQTEQIYRAVIDTKALDFDKTYVCGVMGMATKETPSFYLPININHFYVNDLELEKKESYLDGETNYYMNLEGAPIFFHRIKKGDVLAVDFTRGQKENSEQLYLTFGFVQGPGT